MKLLTLSVCSIQKFVYFNDHWIFFNVVFWFSELVLALSVIDLPSRGPSLKFGVHTLTTRESQYKNWWTQGPKYILKIFKYLRNTLHLLSVGLFWFSHIGSVTSYDPSCPSIGQSVKTKGGKLHLYAPIRALVKHVYEINYEIKWLNNLSIFSYFEFYFTCTFWSDKGKDERRDRRQLEAKIQSK